MDKFYPDVAPTTVEPFSLKQMKPPKGIKIYNTIPEGWVKIDNATAAPRGYVWIFNGESVFSDNFRHALLEL